MTTRDQLFFQKLIDMMFADTEKVKSLPLADTHFQISAKVEFQI